jgi:hypothetical protein
VWCLQKYDPQPPQPTGECVPGEGHTRWVERGWGVKSSEDARHCSVLYKCKYFVTLQLLGGGGKVRALGLAAVSGSHLCNVPNIR